MKTRFLILAALAWSAAGCAAVDPYRSVRIELPGVTPFNIAHYREILVVPFKEEAPPPAGFALAKEATAYLAEDLERDFKGRVLTLEPTAAGPPAPEDEAAWKEKGAAHPQALFLTGTVRLSSEVRKAINENDRDVEGPFKQTGSGLSERRLYTLNLSLGLIDAATGRAVYRQDYKETKTYVATKQPAEFAFFELAQRAKLKFFRTILGTERFQERYLLIR
ncbi:MAG: hypothetical protein OEW05_03540 [Candidatus Aminicenantes bacterium]|nr:hypothetical protein [Candidatus Aminicenantes bacterium]